MELFLDSADIGEIRHALEHWDIDGLTTNPRHIQTSGKSFLGVIGEIAGLFAGTDKPVSVEVDPHLADWESIVRQGRELAAISPNFVIKVGMSEAGCRAVRELTARGVRTNMTLIFTTAQAWLAARSGATYISPFLAWREQYGDEGRSLWTEVAQVVQRHGYPTRIIAAAIRNGRQLAEAALAGAHCATTGFSVYADTFRSPYTDLGTELFSSAWKATAARQDG